MQGVMSEQARLIRPRIGSYAWLAARLENFTLSRTRGVFCNSSYTEALVRSRARRTWLMPHPLRRLLRSGPGRRGAFLVCC